MRGVHSYWRNEWVKEWEWCTLQWKNFRGGGIKTGVGHQAVWWHQFWKQNKICIHLHACINLHVPFDARIRVQNAANLLAAEVPMQASLAELRCCQTPGWPLGSHPSLTGRAATSRPQQGKGKTVGKGAEMEEGWLHGQASGTGCSWTVVEFGTV